MHELKNEKSEYGIDVFIDLFWCVRAWFRSLQQWFKHCLRRRRYSCPLCMQKCSAKNVSRLYFQSVEESNDSVLAKNEEDSQDLRCQIQRLEDKDDGLSSLFRFQGKDLKTGVNSIAFCHFLLLITFVDFVAWIIAKKWFPCLTLTLVFGSTFHYWFCDGFCVRCVMVLYISYMTSVNMNISSDGALW